MFDTESFKRLQREWYTKLRASGFQDIEDSTNLSTAGRRAPPGTDTRQLTTRNRDRYALRRATVVRAGLVDYYRGAERYLLVGVFASAMERRIWVLHAEGCSVRKIATSLSMTKDAVQRRIEKHRDRMAAAIRQDEP